jgi:hypothetical protein
MLIKATHVGKEWRIRPTAIKVFKLFNHRPALDIRLMSRAHVRL